MSKRSTRLSSGLINKVDYSEGLHVDAENQSGSESPAERPRKRVRRDSDASFTEEQHVSAEEQLETDEEEPFNLFSAVCAQLPLDILAYCFTFLDLPTLYSLYISCSKFHRFLGSKQLAGTWNAAHSNTRMQGRFRLASNAPDLAFPAVPPSMHIIALSRILFGPPHCNACGFVTNSKLNVILMLRYCAGCYAELIVNRPTLYRRLKAEGYHLDYDILKLAPFYHQKGMDLEERDNAIWQDPYVFYPLPVVRELVATVPYLKILQAAAPNEYQCMLAEKKQYFINQLNERRDLEDFMSEWPTYIKNKRKAGIADRQQQREQLRVRRATELAVKLMKHGEHLGLWSNATSVKICDALVEEGFRLNYVLLERCSLRKNAVELAWPDFHCFMQPIAKAFSTWMSEERVWEAHEEFMLPFSLALLVHPAKDAKYAEEFTDFEPSMADFMELAVTQDIRQEYEDDDNEQELHEILWQYRDRLYSDVIDLRYRIFEDLMGMRNWSMDDYEDGFANLDKLHSVFKCIRCKQRCLSYLNVRSHQCIALRPLQPVQDMGSAWNAKFSLTYDGVSRPWNPTRVCFDAASSNIIEQIIEFSDEEFPQDWSDIEEDDRFCCTNYECKFRNRCQYVDVADMVSHVKMYGRSNHLVMEYLA